MKQRSTTPVSTSFAAKATLTVVAILMAIAGPIQIGSVAKADKYDDQINAIQRQIDQYQAVAGNLQNVANDLQQKVTSLNVEKAQIQAQVDINQLKYDQLQTQIKETEAKIGDNKTALGDTIANMYIDGNISPLEMLASSKNIGDYVDKQELQSAVRDELTKTIDKIKTLKIQLEKQKADTEKVLADQKTARDALAAKEAEQQNLLNDTKGEQAAYQKLSADSQARLEAVHAEQQAALSRITNGGANNAGAVGAFVFRDYSGNQGCGGGYPYCAPQDTMVDPWGLYNRECVSYSAWRATQMGKQVGHFSGRGNAYEWPSSASGWMGAVVNNTPAVGAVAILDSTPGFSPIGHSMNVEAILGDGWVRVSQYNFGGTGQYSTMDIKASGVVFVHFPS